MDIWDQNKLVVFIAFVVPGFISLKIYQLLCPGPVKDSSQQIVDAVSYSCINYALLLWPIIQIESYPEFKRSYPAWYAAFYVLVVLVAPFCWALVFRKLRETKFVQKSLPHPTARPWDFVFHQKLPYWIVVTLKDKTKIGGLYSWKSFTSNAPEPESIYLEQCWHLDDAGDFIAAKVDTAGILVLASEIATVELTTMSTGEADDREKVTPVQA